MVNAKMPATMVEKTLALIKPDAVRCGKASEIMHLIELANFSIIQKQQLQLTRSRAEEFYGEHQGKPFFNKLIDFMTSGPIWALVLAKPSAIAEWRSLMGPTISEKARETVPKSIRALYGTDGTFNAAHGSDSRESAFREIHFFFPRMVIDQPPDQESIGQYVESASQYIQKHLEPVLKRALTVLAKEKPSGEQFEAITFLGNWLLENNPNKPKIVMPGSALPDSLAVEDEDECEVGNQPVAEACRDGEEGEAAVESGEGGSEGLEDAAATPSADTIPINDEAGTGEFEEDAAVKVQSAYRGYKARKEVADMRAEVST